MSAVTITDDAVSFMREHAGFSWDPKRETQEQGQERCARELAAAEAAFRADPDVFVVWEVDEIDSSDFDSENEPRALYCALLCVDHDYEGAHLVRGYDPRDGYFERPGQVVESLGGIDLDADDPSGDPYKRVIVAELYSEFQATREAAIVRGEN